jgi:GDPmannose 4,6-dehydratase
MWMMLQQENPDDFVICSGMTHSVREFCDLAFSHLGLNYKDHVVVDEQFFRPAEVDLLVGDYSKAQKVLDWNPTTTFKDLVTMMVEADVALLQRRLKGLT